MVIGIVVFPVVVVWYDWNLVQGGTEPELNFAELEMKNLCRSLRMIVVRKNQSHPADLLRWWYFAQLLV